MYLVTVAYDNNSIRVRCAESQRLIGVLDAGSRQIGQISISPCNRLLAAGCGTKVKVWELGCNREFLSLEQGSDVVSVCFDKFGARLAYGLKQGAVYMMDLSSGVVPFAIKTAGRVYPTVCFSSQSNQLIVCHKTAVEVWGFGDGPVVGSVLAATSGHSDSICCIASHPTDDEVATGSNDKTVIIWDLKGKAGKAVLVGHRAAVFSVNYDAEGGLLISGSLDGLAIIWNAFSGNALKVINCQSPVTFASIYCTEDDISDQLIPQAAISASVALELSKWRQPAPGVTSELDKGAVVILDAAVAKPLHKRYRVACAANFDVHIYDVNRGIETNYFNNEGRCCYSSAGMILL
jgi:WD40 repeat protein